MGEATRPPGPRALCVSPDFVRRQRWASWLRSEGYETATCAGFDVTSGCPRLEGSECALREWADVAVVDVTHDAIFELSGGGNLVCTKIRDDGRAVMVHGRATSGMFLGSREAVPHPAEHDAVVRSARRLTQLSL